MSERTCGTCVACCVYLSINDNGFRKSALKACPHLQDPMEIAPVEQEVGATQGMPLIQSKHLRGPGDSNNCTIKHGRPEVCNGYTCSWLLGHGEPDDRPDRSGVLIDDVSNSGFIGNAHIAKPLWFGAEDEPDGKRAIDNISRSLSKPILVLQFTEFKLLRVVGRGVE